MGDVAVPETLFAHRALAREDAWRARRARRGRAVAVLRGERVVLRPPAAADLAAVVAACQDPEIARFIPLIPVPYRDADAEAWLAAVEREWDGGVERTFGVFEQEDGPLRGVVTVRLRDGGTVGYWLAPSARGRGLMTDAMRTVVAWARDEHGIRRLVLTTHPDNAASQRVAERAGFVRVGTTDDHPRFRDGTNTAVLFELPGKAPSRRGAFPEREP